MWFLMLFGFAVPLLVAIWLVLVVSAAWPVLLLMLVLGIVVLAIGSSGKKRN
jgi:hypothetical protein